MEEELIKDAEHKMKNSIDHLLHELGKLRTGQASVALLDDLLVDYYGNPTPLKQVATLGAPDNQTLTIQPWETSILKDIEKAIQGSDLGLTPNNDGKVIFGSTVYLEDLDNGEKINYKIVGKDEADLKEKLLYFKSPIGKGLIGKNKGDLVEISTPAGVKNFEIIDVKYI